MLMPGGGSWSGPPSGVFCRCKPLAINALPQPEPATQCRPR